ncbi:hypothetical protein V8C86DRAFT_2507665 [Haematococcus lacustris]
MRSYTRPACRAAIALIIALVLTHASGARPTAVVSSASRGRSLQGCKDVYKLCPGLASLCHMEEVASSCPCMCGGRPGDNPLLVGAPDKGEPKLVNTRTGRLAAT